MNLLEVSQLSVSFGGVRAVDDLSFTVERNTLHGLIGPNGAGKTTTIEAISGFVSHATGSLRFNGEEIGRLAAHARARRGLVRTFQAVELFEDLTVLENLHAASARRSVGQSLMDLLRPRRQTVSPAVDRALELLELSQLRERLPGELSQGERKLVGVARALACQPELVLLDEPAAGLDVEESAALGLRLRAVVDAGVTVVLVDHDMDLVLSVCDQLTVLDFGRQLATGTPATVRADERVIAAYLGDGEKTVVQS